MNNRLRQTFLLLILYIGFISLGLPDQSLGVAWPEMRRTFNKPLDMAGLIIFITAALTSISSFSSGWFIRRFSIQTILSGSCLLTACGILGYAISDEWVGILLSTCFLGIGAGTIDASLNDYVARHYSSRQMSWLHGCWGIGATLGPAIMTFALARYHDWQKGYLIIAGIQFGLLAVFVLTSGLWKKTEVSEQAVFEEDKGMKLLSIKPLLSMGIFFLYTTVEFSVGLWFYSVMVEGRHVSAAVAGSWITLYWAMLTIGRFGIGFVSNRLGNLKIILLSLMGGIVGLLLLLINTPATMIAGLAVCGLSFAGIYPSMMHETPKRFGRKLGAVMTGFQAGAGSLGVIIMPPLLGIIITRAGLEFLIPLLILFMAAMVAMNHRLNR